MDNNTIVQKLKEKFGNVIRDITEPYGLLTITINAESIIDISRWISTDKELNFNFLTDITAIHYPEQSGNELGVIYHFHCLTNNIRLRIKLFVSKENPVVQTMTGLFESANWMERETFDFYGIQFQGHPNLKRILNMDEMDYFPMQKQYPLEDQQREDKEDKYFGR